MSAVTQKGQVTIPKQFRESLNIREGDSLIFELKNDTLILKKKDRKSILSFGGIGKGRKIRPGDETEYTKRVIARKIAQEGLKNV